MCWLLKGKEAIKEGRGNVDRGIHLLEEKKTKGKAGGKWGCSSGYPPQDWREGNV